MAAMLCMHIAVHELTDWSTFYLLICILSQAHSSKVFQPRVVVNRSYLSYLPGGLGTNLYVRQKPSNHDYL